MGGEVHHDGLVKVHPEMVKMDARQHLKGRMHHGQYMYVISLRP